MHKFLCLQVALIPIAHHPLSTSSEFIFDLSASIILCNSRLIFIEYAKLYTVANNYFVISYKNVDFSVFWIFRLNIREKYRFKQLANFGSRVIACICLESHQSMLWTSLSRYPDKKIFCPSNFSSNYRNFLNMKIHHQKTPLLNDIMTHFCGQHDPKQIFALKS